VCWCFCFCHSRLLCFSLSQTCYFGNLQKDFHSLKKV